MKMKVLFLSCALLALGVVLWWMLQPQTDVGAAAMAATPDPPGHRSLPGDARPSAPLLVTASRQPVTHPSAIRPAGLTDRNTIFSTDAQHQLMIDGEVMQRLQSLVDTLPPQYDLEQLRQVEDTAREGLPGSLALQALQLLHQYLAYTATQEALLKQPRPGNDLQAAQQTLDALIVLRRRHFGEATATSLFAQEEAQQQATLDRFRQEAGR